jgi:hypothetical protein
LFACVFSFQLKNVLPERYSHTIHYSIIFLFSGKHIQPDTMRLTFVWSFAANNLCP